MKSYDAIIIGGGPAGSSCAGRLAQAGCSVLVLDKKVFPRNKPCAGWITPQVVATLQLDAATYGKGRVWQPILGFRCGTMSGKPIECRYEEAVSFGIRRCEFDAYLLDRSGADQQLGEAVQNLHWRPGNPNGEWTVNDQYVAPMLVGAGGHFCPVARRLEARKHTSASVVYAQEVEFQLPRGQAPGRLAADTPELYFCDDLQGYGWCFRKGDYLNVGLGRTDSEDLSTHVARFRDFLRSHERVLCDITGRFSGHAYQLYEQQAPKLFDHGVVLVGDAAGLAYAQSGEGIRPAVESGLIAADVILAAAGDYRREQLASYATRLVERLGPPHHRRAVTWLPAGWLRFLAAQLLATRWFSRRVVLEDWFLHRNQPALEARA